MTIGSVSPGLSTLQVGSAHAVQRPAQKAEGHPGGPDFGERLGSALRTVADAQAKAAEAATAFETGKTENLAGVMIEQQVASLGFQMTLSVRNKALGAYRDIMNMPV